MTLLEVLPPQYDAVYLDLTFNDETWAISAPMPRYVAERACFDFGMGIAWITGQTVRTALIVPWEPMQ